MRVDPDHDIRRRVGTGIPQTVQLVRRLEDHRARTGAPPDIVLQHLECARADDHQLLMWMTMRRVRLVPWRERCDVDLESREIESFSIDERAEECTITLAKRA